MQDPQWMGRTFDQSGAIAEAQARVAEDNARKMQNRVFAQKALGQEADLQESDLGRGLQAGMAKSSSTKSSTSIFSRSRYAGTTCKSRCN